MRILIVEDDPAQRVALIRVLEHEGHSAAWAETGARAIEQLHFETFDVVLLDLGLPGGMSGYEIAGRCLLDERLRRVPIIVVSGKTIDEIEVESRSSHDALASVKAILGKPINVPHLLAILNRIDNPRLSEVPE
jgi:CheY-like chemotaxis protein